jgi:hypothetical protein
VDQPDLGEASRVRGAEVIVDHGRDVARGEGVEIERILDGDRDGLARLLAGQSLSPPVT